MAAIALLTMPPAVAAAQDVAPADEATDDAGQGAAPTAPVGSTSYYPADFAAFNPRTALDMLRQVPGFTVDEQRGNNSRGLGQADGNVLVNGVRVVTKSDSITDQLARISADNVIRIDMVEGATLGIPGLTGRVANVIARSGDGLQVQFEWRPQLATDFADASLREGIVSLSGSTGNLDFTASVEGRPNRGGNGGFNLFTFGDGSTELRSSRSKSNGDDWRLSGSLAYETAGGTLFNLNSSYLHRRFRSFDEEVVIAPVGAPPLVDRFDQRNRGYDFEIGGDVDFAVGPGRLQLIVLDSRADMTADTRSVIDPADGDPAVGSSFLRFSRTGERIGRAEYSWPMWGADWQWSGEAAFNRLDLTGDLALLDANGQFVPIAFPAGTGGVREDRYESSLSYSRGLTDSLTLQLVLGGEYSSIRQTGNNPNQRSFLRPKGSLSLGWNAAEGLDVSLSIERSVGQLNFSDFLAAVNLDNSNQNAANADLLPDQRWNVDLEATRDFGPWGTGTLRFFYRRFQDYVTIIPTPTGGEARGNVPNAEISGFELNGTLQLAPLGLDGAKIDFEASVRDSAFPDPVEGGTLPIQFARPFNYDIDFRWDVPESDWAFGAGFRDEGNHPYYRVREFGEQYAINRNLSMFLEHKDLFGLTVQARVSNLLEDESVLDRSVFDGPRGSSPLLFREYRVREIGRVVNLTVKGSF